MMFRRWLIGNLLAFILGPTLCYPSSRLKPVILKKGKSLVQILLF